MVNIETVVVSVSELYLTSGWQGNDYGAKYINNLIVCI